MDRRDRELGGVRREGSRILKWLASYPVPELNIQNKKSLKIHVVEARKEFDLVMVFWVSPSGPVDWVFVCGCGSTVGPRSVFSVP